MTSAPEHEAQSSPLVAIVTPVYNGAATLEETMLSVQAQTYPALVHVVLNNASKDDTGAIIARFANGRVPVLARENPETLPQMANWNAALTHVPEAARYVQILCADDTIEPTAVAEMTALMEAHPNLGVVGCDFMYGEDRNWGGWGEPTAVVNGRKAIASMITGPGKINPTQMLWRKAAMTRRPFFNEAILTSADLDACYGVLLEHDYGHVAKNLGFCRLSNQTITSTLNAARRWHKEALENLTTYGPVALGADYRAVLRAYQRHYTQRVMNWRRRADPGVDLAPHWQALKASGAPVGFMGELDALAHWALQKLKLRPLWAGWPPWA